jgi:hypothetical protein
MEQQVANMRRFFDAVASHTSEAWDGLADQFDPNLSAPFPLVLISVYSVGFLAVLLVGRSRLVTQTPIRPLAFGLLALVLATISGAQAKWTTILVGVALLGLGVTSSFGADVASLLGRSGRRSRMEYHLAAMGNTVLSALVGVALTVTGAAILAANPIHLCAAVVVTAERRPLRVMLRFRDAEYRQNFKVFWDAWRMVSAATFVFIAGFAGLLLDGYFRWVDVDPNDAASVERASFILQAIIGAVGVVAALSAGSIGLAIQLRSSLFGSDVAFAFLPKRRLLALGAAATAVIVAALFVLGHLPRASDYASGLVPTLVVHAALLVLLWLVVETGFLLSSYARSRPVLSAIGSLPESRSWPDDLRMYGYNAGRRQYGLSEASQLPRSVHLFSQSLRSAIRGSDLELAQEVVLSWSSGCKSDRTLSNLLFRVLNPWEIDRLVPITLTWEECDFLDGLDEAHAEVIDNAAIYSSFNASFAAALYPLVELSYPPLCETRQHNDNFALEEGVPGFRALLSLTYAAVQTGHTNLLSRLVARDWSRNLWLATAWSEKYPVTGKQSQYESGNYVKHAYSELARVAISAPEGRREDLVESIARTLIRSLEPASSRDVLTSGLMSIHQIDPYSYGALSRSWDDLAAIAQKSNANLGWHLVLAERSARADAMEEQKKRLFDLRGFVDHAIAIAVGLDAEAEQHYSSKLQQDDAVKAAFAAIEATYTGEFPFRHVAGDVLRGAMDRLPPRSRSQLADLVWDWSYHDPDNRSWLARLVDGPWLREVPWQQANHA